MLHILDVLVYSYIMPIHPTYIVSPMAMQLTVLLCCALCGTTFQYDEHTTSSFFLLTHNVVSHPSIPSSGKVMSCQ